IAVTCMLPEMLEDRCAPGHRDGRNRLPRGAQAMSKGTDPRKQHQGDKGRSRPNRAGFLAGIGSAHRAGIKYIRKRTEIAQCKVGSCGRDEDGRGSLGPKANAPFPIPAHQTERADFRHSAFRLASPQDPRWSAALCWCLAMTPSAVTHLRLA